MLTGPLPPGTDAEKLPAGPSGSASESCGGTGTSLPPLKGVGSALRLANSSAVVPGVADWSDRIACVPADRSPPHTVSEAAPVAGHGKPRFGWHVVVQSTRQISSSSIAASTVVGAPPSVAAKRRRTCDVGVTKLDTRKSCFVQ